MATAARSDRVLFAEVLVLRQENAVPRRQIARVRYKPADRAWFATLATLVPRVRWSEVFPDTPTTLPSVKTLILRTAGENPYRGHEQIAGELVKPGHQIAKSTVWQILRNAGFDPAPQRSGPHRPNP